MAEYRRTTDREYLLRQCRSGELNADQYRLNLNKGANVLASQSFVSDGP